MGILLSGIDTAVDKAMVSERQVAVNGTEIILRTTFAQARYLGAQMTCSPVKWSDKINRC